MTCNDAHSGAVSVEEVPPADWAGLAARFSDYTYEQDFDYVAAGARRIGARVRLLQVRAGDRPIGAACLRVKSIPGLGRGIAYISSGPMLVPDCASASGADFGKRAETVLGALADQLVRREGHVLRFRLAATSGIYGGANSLDDVFSGLGFSRTDRAPSYRTVVIDLQQDEAELYTGLHSKWRYELRRAGTANLETVVGMDRDFLERFCAIYAKMRSFKDFEAAVSPKFLASMIDTGFRFEISIALHDGQDVAGHVTVFTPGCATYLFGATSETGRLHRAGYQLMWNAMMACKERGIRWYDLGGISKTANPAGRTFKVRTGGLEVLAAGPFEHGSGLGYPLVRAAETLSTAITTRVNRRAGPFYVSLRRGPSDAVG